MNQNKTSDRYRRMKKTSSVQLAMETKKSLKEIVEDFPNNPEAMDYYYKLASAFAGGDKIDTNGKQVIATTCVQVPTELILAADAHPLRLCAGAYATDQIGAEYLPAKTCPLIKSTLGMMHLDFYQVDQKPLAVINPTTCDQKRKLGEITADLVDIPYYSLELPPTKDTEEARIYWQKVVKKFTKYIEHITGNKITRSKLKKSIQKVADAQKEYRTFYNLRKGKPIIFGKDAILITNSYFFDNIENWTSNLKKLNKELEEKVKNEQYVTGSRSPRILLTGSPSIFPNHKIPLLVETLGGVIVAEEFCSTSRMLYDTVAVDEWFLYDMIPALADRYLKPCTCPNFTPNEDRKRRLLEMIKEFSIDGVIYQSFAGCQLFDMESRKVGKILEEHGKAMLFIETDYSPEDNGQISTRVEAFIESLKTRKYIERT
jgi:benzoyl-CoA reductase/2-hydroxyglutaryl-CoA dehydratase subunit BcrC/BadD/HgdB